MLLKKRRETLEGIRFLVKYENDFLMLKLNIDVFLINAFALRPFLNFLIEELLYTVAHDVFYIFKIRVSYRYQYCDACNLGE